MMICHKQVMDYVDPDGQFCHWNETSSLWDLPSTCLIITTLMRYIWNNNIYQNTFKFQRGCDLVKESIQCVENTGVCEADFTSNTFSYLNNQFCDNLHDYAAVKKCINSWSLRNELESELFTNGVVLAVCDQHELRQLALDDVKLNLFLRIPITSIYQSKLHAELTGRFLCKAHQQDTCLAKRFEQICPGYQSFIIPFHYREQTLLKKCESMTMYGGICEQFVLTYCPIDNRTGEINMKMDVADLTHVYNMVKVNTEIDKQVFFSKLNKQSLYG